ncbi:MAG: DUF3016 domain-containing protein [Gammaproteobacteria bacterium]
MKQNIGRGVLAGCVLLASAGAWAGTTVKFVDPEHFRDVPLSLVERERVLRDLQAHIEKLGARLPANQQLTVEVLDVDLAGITEPASTRPDVRIVRGGADWPQMHLRYRLEQDGKLIKSGDEQLSDMNYADHINRYTGEGSLRYEKQMLDDWFRKTLKVG